MTLPWRSLHFRLIYSGACEGQMPAILSMIQVERRTPAPSVVAVALLSICYLFAGSDVFALMNYVGFATWVDSCLLHTCPPLDTSCDQS